MKSILSFFLSILTFFLPLQGILIVVAAAIALDTITGIYKATKKNEPIITKHFKPVFAKMAVYEAVVLLIYCMDYHLLSEFFKLWFSVEFFFTKIISILLIFTELVSIKENIEEAHAFKFVKLIHKLLKGSKEIKNGVNELIK